MAEDRMQKNIEKRLKKEMIVADVHKRQMYRSPQPLVRVFREKIKQTEGEQAFLKYLGAEFEITEQMMTENNKMTS